LTLIKRSAAKAAPRAILLWGQLVDLDQEKLWRGSNRVLRSIQFLTLISEWT
jgi:hypothetical protein